MTDQDAFLKLIVEGKVLQEIVEIEGSPKISVILDWMKDKSFLTRYQTAKKLRSEVFHDKAIRIAQLSDKSTAAADKLAVDTLKWAAAIGDGETYGAKTKVTNDGDGIIIVGTGILRPGDDGYSEEDFDAKIHRHRVQAKETPKGTASASEEV